MSEIIYKSKNAVVICKSPGISSQPDRAGGRDAMTSLSAVLAESGENSTLYPVHRLDNVVGGLIIYARTGKAAAELSALVSTDGVGKEYYAVVDGTPEAGIYTDYLRKDSRQSKAVIASKSDRDAREAVLTLTPIHTVSVGTAEKTLVKILLHTGRFYQIRAQLSSRGAPITGDSKYGSKDFRTRTPALFSSSVSADFCGESISLTHLPPVDKYPWNLFSADKYI